MKQVGEIFQLSLRNVQALTEDRTLHEVLSSAVGALTDSYQLGKSLYICGNGGSAADSQHIAAELVAKLGRNRGPIRALALTTDTSFLTAASNDFEYAEVFSRQVRAHMSKDDVLLALSTSGNSENVVRALRAAKNQGAKTILLSGKSGGRCKEFADYCLLAPGDNAGQIQECHMIIYHTLCYLLESRLAELGMVEFID